MEHARHLINEMLHRKRERAYAQGKLFAPEIVKPEQGALV